AAGWAFLYWQSSTIDLSAGHDARAALDELRAIDARWNDDLVRVRFEPNRTLAPAAYGRIYSKLEVSALHLAYPGLGRSVASLKQAFDEKAALVQRAREGDALIEKAWLVSTGPRLDQTSRLLERAYDNALTQSELYRIWLLYYSGFLLTILGYLAYELWRANRGLEQRVAERTRELSEAMARLQESEARLVQSEKMSALGQMVAGLAHGVNTPLAYVKASVEALQGRVVELQRIARETERLIELLESENADEAELAAQFATVRTLLASKWIPALERQLKDGLHGIGQIAELVGDLQDFSRLDRGKRLPYDLHRGIDATLRIAARELGKRKVTPLYGQIPPVSCSPAQINQAILNLVLNAAQATAEEGGVIAVRTAMRGDDHVTIEVADNGHGIPEDVIGRVFDPFFTTREKASGLGLAIAYRIVEAHGGKLEVQSKVNVGSRFTIVLPLRQQAALAA
ncbi:MAG: hypothetical protein JOZ85_17890, partial [Betaproteobacteria bacterium]|nr:hypothetical protein [Betaproteobacteria bacterium]